MKIAIAALIPLLVLALVAHRIKSNSPNGMGGSTGIRNPLTQIILCLGLGKLCRIPHITDDIISPALQRWTGIANLMTLTGMTFGSLAAIPILAFSSYITGRNLRPRIQYIAAITTTVAMIATFLISPMSRKASSFLPNDFAVTNSVLPYWIAFIAPLAVSTLMSSTYTIRDLLWVRRGPFARALAGMAVACSLGFAYCVFNVVNLVLKYNNDTASVLYRNSYLIHKSLSLAAPATAALSATIFAWSIWKDRLHRYRLLRHNGSKWIEARTISPEVVLDQTYHFSPTRLRCWRASRSHEAAYRLQIELADHQHQATRSSALTSHAIS